MNILCFSDWRTQEIEDIFEFIKYYQTNKKKKIDLIIYAGDDIARFKDKDRNYFSELAEVTTLKKVLAVIGNDCTYESKKILNAKGIIDLHEKDYEIEGLLFIGQEGSNGEIGHVLYTEEEIKRNISSRINKNKKNILVSHTPPHEILDYSIRFSNDNIGSKAIRQLINNGRLHLVVCGHSHLNGGNSKKIKKTTVLNVASDEDSVGLFCIVDISKKKLAYEFYDTNEILSKHPLSKLQQVGFRRLKQLIGCGFNEYDQINENNREQLKKLPGVYDWHVTRWIEQIKAIETGNPVLNKEELKEILGKKHILYDIETDLSNEHVFMIGAYDSSTEKFKQFFCKKDQERLVKEFAKYVSEHKGFNLISYSNCNFEKRILAKIADKSKLSDLLSGLEAEKDLGAVMQNLIIGDFKEYSLKSLSAKFGFKKKSKLDGFQVGAQYTQYLQNRYEPDWNEIKKYNKEDVFALKCIIDKILNETR